jgi:hypothetical protein
LLGKRYINVEIIRASIYRPTQREFTMKENVDSEVFGRRLAGDVADLLDEGGKVLDGWSSHWMCKKGEHFVYELLKGKPREIFSTKDKGAFVEWLSTQSAASLDAYVRPFATDTIEIITVNRLKEAVRTKNGVIDATPYGEAMAARVAEVLEGGVKIMYDHRDYCGMGLLWAGSRFLYGECQDGYMLDGEERSFGSRAEFVEWLSEQSDESLSGRGLERVYWNNQRITKKRLEAAIGGKELSS